MFWHHFVSAQTHLKLSVNSTSFSEFTKSHLLSVFRYSLAFHVCTSRSFENKILEDVSFPKKSRDFKLKTFESKSQICRVDVSYYMGNN